MLQPENSINEAPSRGRLWKLKNLYAKTSVILSSVSDNPEDGITFKGTIKFIFSSQGSRLVKKFFKKSLAIITNREVPEKKNTVEYSSWRMRNMPGPGDFLRYEDNLKRLSYQPLISILIPAYNTPVDFLTQTIDSVFQQIYQNWEICIADDNSTNEDTKALIQEYAKKDARIKIVMRETNGHIAECTNSALQLASGEYCALFDHDDLLTRDALYHMVALMNDFPEADFIYSDEDKTDGAGTFSDPNFKPDWSPENLLSTNYLGHLVVLRTSILKKIGGFRKEYNGSQDYDMYLRFTEQTDHIFHIPKVLYHWRMHEASVAMNFHSKPYAYIAGKKALEDAIARRNEPGEVSMLNGLLGYYSIRYKIKKQEKVSIIIPTKNKTTLLRQCVNSILEFSTWPDYEIIIVDNGSTEQEFFDFVNQYTTKFPEKVRHLPHNTPFNFSELINAGVAAAKGNYFILLNNDTKVISHDWIEAMVEQAQRPSTGVVGAKLLFPDNTIQHAGIILNKGTFATHVFSSLHKNVYNTHINISKNFSAVTGACMMVRRDVFEEVNGFDKAFAVEFNDIDFCLKTIIRGYQVIYTPHASLYHYESASRGSSHDTAEKFMRYRQESKLFTERWKYYIENDPAYNINLSHDLVDFVALNV